MAFIERGLAPTRSAAQHMVPILIDGLVADKPSREILTGATAATDNERTNPWMSRGGLRLEAA